MKIIEDVELQVLLESPEGRRLKPGERVVTTVAELLDVLRTVEPESRIHVQGGGPSKGRYLSFSLPRSQVPHCRHCLWEIENATLNGDFSSWIHTRTKVRRCDVVQVGLLRTTYATPMEES